MPCVSPSESQSGLGLCVELTSLPPRLHAQTRRVKASVTTHKPRTPTHLTPTHFCGPASTSLVSAVPVSPCSHHTTPSLSHSLTHFSGGHVVSLLLARKGSITNAAGNMILVAACPGERCTHAVFPPLHGPFCKVSLNTHCKQYVFRHL